MTNKIIFKKFILLLFFSVFLQDFFCEEKQKWTIAVQKFTFAKGQEKFSVNNALAETIPVAIAEKLSNNLERNILPDELYERESRKLLKNRQDLFLQLSSEYKKRDALVLQNFSENALKSKIKEEEKKISEIQKKIDNNLKQQNELLIETEKKLAVLKEENFFENANQNEAALYKNLIKNIFSNEKSIIQNEQIVFYQNDYQKFYEPTEKTKNLSPLNKKFENEIVSKNINTLITGAITKIGDYLSVKVEVILYPNAKIIGSVIEIGALNDLDFIASSIARKLVPILTNSMPINVKIKINPAEIQNNAKIYIDGVLFSNQDSFLFESGVHNLLFSEDGYKTASTNFYFEGNTEYLIEVNLEEKKDGILQIGLVKPVFGDIFANGQPAQKNTNRKSTVTINGNQILGEFICENGENAFFYIPENLVFADNFVSVEPKPLNREKYIDTRRKWMYGSYSMLIISLIPTFILTGELQNTVKLYNDSLMSYDEAIKIQNMANIFSGISIGCGVFFVFELVRYFFAANSVLPKKAKSVSAKKAEVFDIPFEEPASVTDEIKNEESEKKESEISVKNENQQEENNSLQK